MSAAVHSAGRGRLRHTRATTTTPPDRSSPPDRSLPLPHRGLGTRAVTTPLRAMHWQDLSVVQPVFVSRMSDGNVELVRRRLFARRASASRAACGRVGVDESGGRPGDVRLVGRPGLPSGRRAFAAPPLRRRLTRWSAATAATATTRCAAAHARAGVSMECGRAGDARRAVEARTPPSLDARLLLPPLRRRLTRRSAATATTRCAAALAHRALVGDVSRWKRLRSVDCGGAVGG